MLTTLVIVVVSAAVCALLTLPVVERYGYWLLTGSGVTFAKAKLALSWLGTFTLYIVAWILLGFHLPGGLNLPFVLITGIHLGLYGIVAPRQVVYDVRRQERLAADSKHYLTSG